MSTDGPTNMYDGELAALQRIREMESLNISPISTALSKIADVISQFGVPGAGLFAKALENGQTPVEKVVEQLESGAYAQINRIWKHLDGQDAQLREFTERLQNQEAQSAYQSAILHALRTSDPKKQALIGALTINCIYANELKPEILDDMMRAVVELKEADVSLLGKIYKSLKPLLDRMERARQMNPLLSFDLHNGIQTEWQNFARTLNPAEQLVYRSSMARLQSHGMIQQVSFSNFGLGHEPYLLLEEGVKFYQRLQKIADATEG